jgi:hypothetical protein
MHPTTNNSTIPSWIYPVPQFFPPQKSPTLLLEKKEKEIDPSSPQMVAPVVIIDSSVCSSAKVSNSQQWENQLYQLEPSLMDNLLPNCSFSIPSTTDGVFNRIWAGNPMIFSTGLSDQYVRIRVSQKEIIEELFPDDCNEFRFRDYRRKVIDALPQSFLRGSEDGSRFPEHAVLDSRLPHRISRREYAYRLQLLVFHHICLFGVEPLFLTGAVQKKMIDWLPDFARMFLPDIAFHIFEDMHFQTISTTTMTTMTTAARYEMMVQKHTRFVRV